MFKILSIQDFRCNPILNFSKIIVIVIFTIAIFANVVPYFEATHDSYVYALESIKLTKGTWSVSNNLLLETGDWEFVPNSWKKTVFNTAIPKYPPGLPAIGSIFYMLGGLYGLFYLSPIFATILLIISERVSTNLFGKYVGFLTLLFLASNGIIFISGIHLLSDNIFSALTVLGFFCLIKFLYQKNLVYLVFASSLLSFSAFIRVSGIIYFPFELLIVIIYFSYKKIKHKDCNFKSQENNNQIKLQKNRINRFYKISIAILIPWLIFILFFLSFNNYYFGDPLTTFYNVPDDPWHKPGTGSYFSIFEPKESNFEIIKGYSNFVLPYPLYKIEVLNFEKIQEERNDPLTSSLLVIATDFVGKNQLGLLTFLVIILAFFVMFNNQKRTIVLIFGLIVFINILFWSAGHVSFGRDSILGRYMVPTFPFFSMLASVLAISLLKFKTPEKKFSRKILLSILKIVLVIGLILFFIVAWYNSPIGQWALKDDFNVKDPKSFINYYPLDLEGLDQKSIIVGGHSAKAIDYGLTTFDISLGAPIQRTAIFNPDSLDPQVIEKLKNLVSSGENLYVFKELINKNEKIIREYLVEKQGFLLIDYSKTFCKLELVDTSQSVSGLEIKEMDEVCYGK